MNLKPKSQKIALKKLLDKIFPDYNLITEGRFEWGNVPKNADEVFHYIYEPLHNYRGFTAEQFAKQRAINYDFVINEIKLIIEYDEKQHFSIPRKISLENYPDDIQLNFDKKYWISECERIHARDNDPIYRDEQRAFRDSIRDISAFKNGYTIIRIKHGDYNFEDDQAENNLKQLLKKYKVIKS